MKDEDLNLLLDYAQTFLGYGHFDAQYWFVGLEEAGVQCSNQALTRAQVWEEFGRIKIIDLFCYVQRLAGRPYGLDNNPRRDPKGWFRENKPRIQSTWGPLIRFLLAVEPAFRENGNDGIISNDEIRSFQSAHWGRSNSNTCLLELFGLPKAAGKRAWPYEDIPRLRTRELGTVETFGQRKQEIQGLLKKYEAKRISKHKIVLFYGRSDFATNLWSHVCGIQRWNVTNFQSDEEFLWYRRKQSNVLFLAIKHPARGRIGRVQEADFMPWLAKAAHALAR